MQISARLFTLGAALALLSAAGCSGTPSLTPTSAWPQSQQLVRSDGGTGRPTEIYNHFVTTQTVPPNETPTNYELYLSGNLVNDICGATNPPCLGQPLWGPYNPFCPPGNGQNNPCYPTVTYNPNTNVTTVSFAGATLYQNTTNHPGLYHFGLLTGYGPGQSQDRLVGCGQWSFPASPNVSEPFVSVNWNPTVKTSTKWAYAEVFVGVALKKGGPPAYGGWTEVAYVPNGTGQPALTFTNYGSQTLYVTSSGIVPDQKVPSDPECLKNPSCAENMGILAGLNFAGSPPPGTKGSHFITLMHPPSSVLMPQKGSPCPT